VTSPSYGNRSLSASIAVGGGELLRAFFSAAASLRPVDVLIVTPYVDVAAFCSGGVAPDWRTLVESSRVTAVVRTMAAAQALRTATAQFGSPRLRVLLNDRLHAKIYVAVRGARGVALLGSQNLTGAALYSNAEAGVLVIPDDAASCELIRRIYDVALTAARSARGVDCFSRRSLGE
jgi:hypothetical protein